MLLPMSPEDAFRILNISEEVTPDEIRHAYRIMALQWHPDRHHNLYDKDRARVHFLQATDAYRTLVRAGYVTRLPPIPGYSPPLQSPLSYQSSLMTHRSSSESTVSLDSFVHLVASSVDSHTTAPSSNMRDSPNSWKQGIRTPAETLPSQHRHPTLQSNYFNYEPPQQNPRRPPFYRSGSSFVGPLPTPSTPATPAFQNIAMYSPAYPQVPYFQPTANGSRANIHPPPPTPPYQGVPTTSYFPQQTPYFQEDSPSSNPPPPYSIPLQSLGIGTSGEWVYSLALTLEELFAGKRCRFGITRSYMTDKTKKVVIEIDIPPGCKPGTRIVCRNVGHEWRPGSFQDIAFIIEDVPHDRFVRLFDDLVMEVRLPWAGCSKNHGGKVPFMGIDGRSLVVEVENPKDKAMRGRSIVKGAGMPVRERGKVVGRGNLVVQWEILPRKPKFLHFMKRLFGRSK
ncbi:hypothetical protein CPB83DRAFT_623906 [Crepidotus variabilis]|uniref:J domain-containing protein n=1 Tax=Crepidotus variabilis TaxID=179855 RepID=A0A9P6JUH7_9AGAR|nr:hypothetical protein CPB83DRAFT_623906 [Crepidotus variabilis]